MSSNDNQNSSETENLCVVCFKNVDIYSVGVCDHAVCFECSTRMRVLCRQNECPICRQDLPKVVFTKTIEPYNKLIMKAQRLNWQDRKYGMFFCSSEIQQAYYKLLEYRCSVCEDTDRNYFKTFQQLKDHMRRVHELFYCDICVENLKIFSFERRTYTRQELAHHRRRGDPDNTSHRGHPLCEFCDTRYMDSDELFRHLRRNHLFCHFCDADGKHQYYNSMEDLRKHFQEEHYLCEEGECKNMPLTAVFREDIDLKAHLAREHSKSLSKSANKQARTLELEFTLAPRPRQENTRNRRPVSRVDRNEEEHHGYEMEPGGPGGGDSGTSRVFVNPLTPQDFPALGSSGSITVQSRPSTTLSFTAKRNALSSEDFPSLGQTFGRPSSAVTITTNTPSGRSSRAPEVTITRTVKGQQGLRRDSDNFPALGMPSTSSTSGSVHLRLNSNNPDSHQVPKVSIHVNHKPSGSVTHITSQPVYHNQQVPQKPTEDFPALGKRAPVPQQPQWVQPKPKKEPKAKKVAPAPQLPPTDLSDFPSLSKVSKNDKKAKKSSSITMPINATDAATTSSTKPSASSYCVDSGSKQKNKSTKNNEKPKSKASSPTIGSKLEDLKIRENDNKNKNKKKKSKSNNGITSNSSTTNINNNTNSESAFGSLNESSDRKNVDINANNDNNSAVNNRNGIVKKRSELRIGTLSVADPFITNNVSSGDHKPPPGFTSKPPPGFNISAESFPTLGNSTDLTFTNSSGQSYSIQPNPSYYPPQNFAQRNEILCQKFMSALNNKDAIQEFKNYSYLFRNGSMDAEKYYEHCKFVLGSKFEEIFPELLVLLPDIEKQQELYNVHSGKSKQLLMVCENCRQVILKKELSQHHNYHTLDNHFPSLDKKMSLNNAWNTN